MVVVADRETVATASEEMGELTSRSTLFCLHFYQPPREIALPDGKINVVPEVNPMIYEQCYRNLLTEGWAVQPGVEFSLYPSLRYWMEEYDQAGWERTKEHVDKLPDREEQLLGDPFFHVILPFLNRDDKDLLLNLGRKAYEKDFGFSPKGIWLPETAVDTPTLEAVEENGYEFVVLRDDQLRSHFQNPMNINLPNGRRIAAVHFDAGLSGSVAFNPHLTRNGDLFYDNQFENDHMTIGVDGETFGHHIPLADHFLRYATQRSTMSQHQRRPFNARASLRQTTMPSTEIVENSSWSCAQGHELGRWKGTCNCDDPSEHALQDKQYFYNFLTHANSSINTTLDFLNPFWRPELTDMILHLRKEIMTGKDFITPIRSAVSDSVTQDLYLAKIYALAGMTSCGWFFGGDDRPERNLPAQSITTIQNLIYRDN